MQGLALGLCFTHIAASNGSLRHSSSAAQQVSPDHSQQTYLGFLERFLAPTPRPTEVAFHGVSNYHL